ncbi:MAG TPA: stage II sporulation protein P [Symbiobacteriaceae bacterium]|jgi:stage II sporulation protein P|nr:stage II sporulation protein P [Symbiobacteriaceae bacterium]
MELAACHADEVIATNRIWTAKPLLVAYVVAVGFTVGMLIDRAPGGSQAVPVTTGANDAHGHWEREATEPPLWLQLFRPSQPTARRILRTGLPILAVADGSSQEAERHQLDTLWAGQAGERPQTFFQTVLPFLRPTGQAQVKNTLPPAPTESQGTPPDPGPDKQPMQPSTPSKPPATAAKPQPVKEGVPLVGIYSTHDWESYLSEFPAMKVSSPGDLDNIKSEDHSKRTIMEVGRTLALRLKELGVTTVYADYTHRDLGYDYAYKTSRATAKEILKRAPSVKVLVDLHRDSGWGQSLVTEVGGKQVAQVRCIIGSNNPKWEQNRQFCESLMQRLEAKYPGITLPIRVQTDNYNQDIMPGAILLEIGGAMNQFEQADRSARYLAEVLADMIREDAYPQ